MFFSLSFFLRKTTVFIQQAKLQLDANRPKSPPPPPPSFLPFGDIVGSHCLTWHNFAKPYFMHHWPSHWGPGRKPPQWPKREKFWNWIYPFHPISSNFHSAGRKPPPPSSQRGKNSETESIHFMQFPATFIQLAENPPPHPAAKEGKILRLNLSISCNFQQLWFSWQKAPPLPHSSQRGKKFWDWIYPFHAISSNFHSAGRTPPPPTAAKEGKLLRLNLSISCNFQQLWFTWHRVPTAPGKPGKMTTVFPVLEKYWNFIILLKILEKWEWTWKNELSGKNSFKLIVATFISAV